MRYLLFACLLMFSLMGSSCKYINLNILQEKTSFSEKVLKEKQDSIRLVDSIRIIEEELLALENTKLDSVRNEDENRKILNSRLKYKIIVGSFSNFENARDLSESYKARGFNSDIIIAEDDSLEYVFVEAYDNQKKAEDRLREFKATIEPKAWLYVAK